MQIIISSNPENLAKALTNHSATVEAEYGSKVVLGSILTLAHHGDNWNRPCPSSINNLPDLGITSIGVSHIDLDTIGGVLAILGRKPNNDAFWAVAAHIDIRGIHKAHLHPEYNAVKPYLDAFYAYSEANKVFSPRNGSALDITKQVEDYCGIVLNILNNDADLLQKGRAWYESKTTLERDSKIKVVNDIIVRQADSFVNHLYEDKNAVLALNTKYQSITLSFAEQDDPRNACTIMQSIFGELAGGHKGIAGSPRGQTMTESDIKTVIDYMETNGLLS